MMMIVMGTMTIQVVSVDIKRDKQTGRNLGYGFVQMSSHQEALDAKAGLHEKEVQGRKVRVGWAQRNTSLFVGKIEHLLEPLLVHNLIVIACLFVQVIWMIP